MNGTFHIQEEFSLWGPPIHDSGSSLKHPLLASQGRGSTSALRLPHTPDILPPSHAAQSLSQARMTRMEHAAKTFLCRGQNAQGAPD